MEKMPARTVLPAFILICAKLTYNAFEIDNNYDKITGDNKSRLLKEREI